MRTVLFGLLLISGLSSDVISGQSVPSLEEVQQFFGGNKIMISYREGGPVYGTFYVIEVHFCPNGYGLYGQTSKQTVMGNYQNSNWQEFGTWQVMEQNGLVGMNYVPLNGQANFVPIYKAVDGTLFINETTTMINQGPAICY